MNFKWKSLLLAVDDSVFLPFISLQCIRFIIDEQWTKSTNAIKGIQLKCIKWLRSFELAHKTKNSFLLFILFVSIYRCTQWEKRKKKNIERSLLAVQIYMLYVYAVHSNNFRIIHSFSSYFQCVTWKPKLLRRISNRGHSQQTLYIWNKKK